MIKTAGTKKKASRSKRPHHPVPAFIRKALVERGLTSLYCLRPPYQRNDYVGWITRAKLPATRQKRLEQMLDELARGDVYMNMPYTLKRPRRRTA